MNFFQRLWSTPKFHAAVSVASGLAAAVFPQYGLILATVSALAGSNAAILPHPAAPLVPPAAAPAPAAPLVPVSGSMHSDDYARAILAVADAYKAAQAAPPGRQ